ncbi:helix-turn-helix domain-containing protein [Microbacterium aurantiacum]|uniref:helix-turn-helix domain-containing protein n=1 Tax=Microbacterium aurantiacum TaxID=162393 RepID=UPI003D725F1E
MSRRELTYTWRVREIMARRRIFTAKELAPLLQERGITLTPNAIWRIVSGEPERVSLKMLVALCDALDVEMNDLITYTAVDAKTTRRRRTAVNGADGLADLNDYRPVRARIVDDDE